MHETILALWQLLHSVHMFPWQDELPGVDEAVITFIFNSQTKVIRSYY